jgi:transcriptional regulator of acetoin/glycerol metabolism
LLEPEHLPDFLGPCQGEPSTGQTTPVKEMGRVMILDALRRNDWNRKAAAEVGYHKSTFFRKVKSFGIELPVRDRRSAVVTAD